MQVILLPYVISAEFGFTYLYPLLRQHQMLQLYSSRLDYCNSLLNNIAKQDLSKLQRVQNCLACVELRAPRFSPSLPLLKQLQWLPINYRIKSKLSTLTYRALAIHQPPYLASLLHFSNIPRQLRSSTLNSRRPLKLMMTHVCPRLLNMINDFVLLLFRARAPEDLSAIEVIFIVIVIFNNVFNITK